MIELELANSKAKVYLDTGASLNVIESDYANTILDNNKGEILYDECTIYGANGNQFQSNYKLRTSIKCGKKITPIEFTVIDNIIVPSSVILGYPLMDENQITINFKN